MNISHPIDKGGKADASAAPLTAKQTDPLFMEFLAIREPRSLTSIPDEMKRAIGRVIRKHEELLINASNPLRVRQIVENLYNHLCSRLEGRITDVVALGGGKVLLQWLGDPTAVSFKPSQILPEKELKISEGILQNYKASSDKRKVILDTLRQVTPKELREEVFRKVYQYSHLPPAARAYARELADNAKISTESQKKDAARKKPVN
jgi:hypothetical protein